MFKFCRSSASTPFIQSQLQNDHSLISIGVSEFHKRRLKLLKRIEEGAFIISSGYALRYIYPFHQNTDFLYLSGINEQDCALIIEKNSKSPKGYNLKLFLRPNTDHSMVWDGPRIGMEGALKNYGADESVSIDKFESCLSKVFKKATNKTPIYTDLPFDKHRSVTEALANSDGFFSLGQGHLFGQVDRSNPTFIQKIFSTAGLLTPTKGTTNSLNFQPLSNLIQEERLVKSDCEIKVMQKAGSITGEAFCQLIRDSHAGISERNIWANLDFQTRSRGAQSLAYVPVVAGGSRALHVHYVNNNQTIKDGEMVLVDGGAYFGGYVSDITRCWPINGTWKKGQLNLYNAVLNANIECIKKCTEESKVSLDDIHHLSFEILKEELQRLFNRKISTFEMNALYPHHVSHYLGMDVHDTALVSTSRKLKRNNVVTIEPALYVPDSLEYPVEYRGVGVRVEDDVVVAGCGAPLVLSSGAPKSFEEIGEVMRKNR